MIIIMIFDIFSSFGVSLSLSLIVNDKIRIKLCDFFNKLNWLQEWRFSSHKHGDRSLLFAPHLKNRHIFIALHCIPITFNFYISSFYFFNFIRRIHSLHSLSLSVCREIIEHFYSAYVELNFSFLPTHAYATCAVVEHITVRRGCHSGFVWNCRKKVTKQALDNFYRKK